jgi:ketosteroid isomerase-like protein
MDKTASTLALADKFFDALEQKDFETFKSCYAPEALVWHSHDNLYESRESSLARLEHAINTHKKMEYANRRVRVFEGGFVQQHTCVIHWDNGHVGSMDTLFIAYVRDGMMSRIYEYFDTGQREKFLGPLAKVIPPAVTN